MFTSIILVATSLSSIALAAPAIVPTLQCSTITEGYLSGDTTVYSSPFSLFPNGTLGFDPATMVSFHVQFQKCYPNFAGYSNIDVGVNGTYAGHIYVPTLDQCLSVQTPGAAPPYTVTTATCSFNDDSSQVLLNWVMTNQKIYYAGNTQADGSNFQGGDACPGSGLFGFLADDGELEGVAAVIGVTPLVCATDMNVHGFRIFPEGQTQL